GAGRNDDAGLSLGEARLPVDDDLSFALFDAEELVVAFVDLFADLFARLKGHQHQLQVTAGVEHAAIVVVVERGPFDVVQIALHGGSSGRTGRVRLITRLMRPGLDLSQNQEKTPELSPRRLCS